MNEQKRNYASEAQRQLQETRVHVPEGMYNVLELYKYIDELHILIGREGMKEMGDE